MPRRRPDGRRLPEHCPCCKKGFRSLADTLRHMNQRAGCKLRIEKLFDFTGSTRRTQPNDSIRREFLNSLSGPNLDAAHADLPDDEPNRMVKDMYVGAAQTYGQGSTFMDGFDRDVFSQQRKVNVFYPFNSRAEWQFASFIMRSSMSMACVDALLTLELIRDLKLSFSSARELRKLIELLPSGPEWLGKPWPTSHPTKDPVVLYYKDPLKCIESLFSNPLLQDYIELTPYRVYKTAERLVRVFSEWMSGDVAERLQAALPHGATLLGTVLSSDKTTITAMTGDRTAYPLLLSLANIKMQFRMKGSQHAFVLLALLPVPKFIHPNKRVRGLLHDRLTHACLDHILEPLKKAAALGVMLTDPLGFRRFCFTPLASYIVDTPEATMLAGVASRSSPITTASYDNLGDPFQHTPRFRSSTLERIKTINLLANPWSDLALYIRLSTAKQLNGVHLPFWRDWPLSEPCVFLTPEMLHHWHRFFWDHDAKWCIKALGSLEIDFRYSLLQPVTGFRHFKSGISHLKQVTGRDHREMQRYIIGVIADAVPRGFVLAIRALSEFRYLAQASQIDDGLRQRILKCLESFHTHKQSILDLRARVGKGNNPIDHFKLPKLELLWSVIAQIELNGVPLQWSADTTEHAHIQFVKDPAEKTNNQNYIVQICQILRREDKTRQFDLATSIRTAGITFGLEPLDVEEEEDDDGDNYTQYISTTSALLSEINPVSNIGYSKRILFDLFKESATLLSGQIPNVPRPLRTFCVYSTAFRLPRDPHITNVTVDEVAELFGLPDLRPALADYIIRFQTSSGRAFKVGGRRTSSQGCELPFQKIQVFCKLRIQNRSYHDPETILPARTLNILPPSREWPLGRYDTVIFNTDSHHRWPKSGIRGHTVGQIRVILRPIIPRGSERNPALDGFLAYIQRYDFIPQPNGPRYSLLDPVTGMFPLKRSQRSDSTVVGDIIPVIQIRSPAHLIPRFGQTANPQWTKETCLEYSNNSWLNPYFDKEDFFCLRSNDVQV